MNETGKGLCFSCVVFGDYQNYIPFYIYSALKVYPDAWCKIFVDQELDKPIADSLDLLIRSGTHRFDFDYDFLKRMNFLDEIEQLKIIGGNKKIARWLIPKKHFGTFDYVFLGDIDFLILKEDEPIIDFHLKRMAEYNLPFSNIVRPLKENETPRLSGLHFIKVDEYYKILNNTILDLNFKDGFISLLKKRDFFNNIDRDEKFLYCIVNQKFQLDLKLIVKEERFRPWHGIHLGAARGLELSRIKFDIGSSIVFENAKNQINSFIDDAIFRTILYKLNETSVWNTVNFFNLSYPSINYFFYRFTHRIKLLIQMALSKIN